MVKKVLLFSLLLLTQIIAAQENSASPYSYYGLGENKFQGTLENRSMGGLGILPDSLNINLQNPASLVALKLTTFSIGGTYNSLDLKNNSATEKAQRTTLDYLAMVFPTGKLSFSLGLMPNSAVGYSIIKTLPNETFRYTGKGGTNRVFLGSGYALTNKFSIGAEVSYIFGTNEKNSSAVPQIQFGTRELKTNAISGISINTGIIFKSKFKKLDVVSSLIVTPETSLNSKNNISLAKISLDGNGNEQVFDIIEILGNKSKIVLPTKFAFGAGIGNLSKWFVGAEATMQGASDFGSIYASNISFEKTTKLSLGGYFTPNYNSYSNYFKKITYRSGFRFENTGLVINNQAIKDQAFTAGIGLPLGFANKLNIGMEVGKKGTSNANLITENYLNISIGITFSDKWFVKRKFD